MPIEDQNFAEIDHGVLKAISAAPWAITQEAFEQICAIAARANVTPEMLATKPGSRLEHTQAVTMRGDVAVISIRGPIFRYANLFTQISGATSVEILARDFAAALGDRRASAILLEIDSPGGQVPGISEFADQVREGSNVKPVVSYISAHGQSAAYWIAAAAGEVVANQTAVIGSIGTVIGIGAKQSDGFIEFVSNQSPRKRADPRTDEGRSEYQRLADDLAQVFIQSVADFRGVTVSDVLDRFGAGGSLVGAHAVTAGMADRMGAFESILAGLSGDNTRGTSMNAKTNMASPEITIESIASDHPAVAEHFRAEGREAVTSKTVPITLDTVRAEHPDIVTALVREGADTERARIQAVEAQTLPGFEKLIADMKFDGSTTGDQAAAKVVAASKAQLSDRADAIRSDAAAVADVPAAPTSDDGVKPALEARPLDERVQAEWDASADIRAEFESFDRYKACRKAEEKGQARVLSK